MEKYTNKENTPLTWYKFTKYVRTPIGIVVSLYNTYLMMTTRINELTICFSVVFLVLVILGVVKYGWIQILWIFLIDFVAYIPIVSILRNTILKR